MTADGTAVLEQFVYGKLVTRPGGPIVPGSEHRCTGLSIDFPRDLDPFCHPSRLGLGERDARRWAQSGWRDEGGIVSLGAVAPSGVWVMMARVRERSEEGEEVEGRLYAQALYTAMPAHAFRWDTLLRAAPVLRAVPREHYDMALPPIELPGPDSDDSLPNDWLDQLRLDLRAVASGVPVNVQDWAMRPSTFLKRMTWALAAFPTTLRWRLPIGAGMLTMDNATAMAYGVAALGGLRIIGGVPRNETDFDLSRGDRYVEWLSRFTTGSATASELAERVAHELPTLDAFDAIDPAMPWNEAARRTAEVVGEKMLLVHVHQGTRIGDSRAIRHMRPELIAILARRVTHGDSSVALSELSQMTGADWHDAWRDAFARAVDSEREALSRVALLLGLAPIETPSQLLALVALELGDVQNDAVASRVLRLSDDAMDPTPWLPLLRAAAEMAIAGQTSWATVWRDRAMPRLAWLALGHALARGDTKSAVLAALPDRQVVITARSVLRDLPVTGTDLAELIDLARPSDRAVIDALIARAFVSGAWQGFRIAELAHARGIPTVMDPPHGADRPPRVSDDLREQLANEVAGGDRDVGPLMLRDLLLHQASQGTGQKAVRLRKMLASLVGDPYATALFGAEPLRRDAPLRGVAEAFALKELVIDDEVADRLLQRLKDFAGADLERAGALLRRWLASAPASPASDRRWPVARAVRALANDSEGATFAIASTHVALVKYALLALRVPSGHVAQAAHDESALRLAMEYWHDREKWSLTSDQLSTLLNVTMDERADREWWIHQIRGKEWDDSPGWRWITQKARDLTETERRAVVRLDGEALMTLVLNKLPVPVEGAAAIQRPQIDWLLRQVSKNAIADLPPGDNILTLLRRLMWFAEQAKDERLLDEIARAVVKVMREDGLAKRTVDQQLRDRGWSWLSMKLRDPQTSLELIRVLANMLRRSPESLVDDYWEKARPRDR